MLRSSGTSKKGSCMALNRPRQKWRGDRLVIAHISSTPHIAASVVICQLASFFLSPLCIAFAFCLLAVAFIILAAVLLLPPSMSSNNPSQLLVRSFSGPYISAEEKPTLVSLFDRSIHPSNHPCRGQRAAPAQTIAEPPSPSLPAMFMIVMSPVVCSSHKRASCTSSSSSARATTTTKASPGCSTTRRRPSVTTMGTSSSLTRGHLRLIRLESSTNPATGSPSRCPLAGERWTPGWDLVAAAALGTRRRLQAPPPS